MASSGTLRVSLRGLRTFCVAARHESFRKAARELFITPSAVSHQIKSLEQELGRPLFARSSRELNLTDVGRSLYEEISPLIDQLQQITAGYREAGPQSSVRVSVQPFFASEFFVPRLREFTDKHPGIDIQVGTSDETEEKHPSDADLSIRLFRSPPAELSSSALFPLRLAPAGSPDFRNALKIEDDAIVSDFPLIVHEGRPKAWNQWSKATGIRLPEDAKTIRLDSMIAIVRAAERGIGAALVPVPISDLWFKYGSIVRLFKQELVTDASYYLVWKEAESGDDGARILRDWILKSFSRFR